MDEERYARFTIDLCNQFHMITDHCWATDYKNICFTDCQCGHCSEVNALVFTMESLCMDHEAMDVI